MEVEEKRQYKRYKYTEPIEFQFLDPEKFGGVLSCDLCEGGIRINFKEFIPLGTELTIRVKAASEDTIECLGKVAWVSKMPLNEWYQVGIKFNNDDSGIISRKKIGEHIKNRILKIDS